MGMELCRQKAKVNLNIGKEEAQECSKWVVADELTAIPLNSFELHNLVKESLPCHIKLATDRGNSHKAKTFRYTRGPLMNSKKFSTLGLRQRREASNPTKFRSVFR